MPSFASYPSLKDRAVFVSGGGSGIGASIVEHLAAQGAKVGFVDIDEAASKALGAKIAAAGHPAPLFAKCDVRDIAAYQAALAELAGRLGPFTVLINNAARDDRHALEDVTTEFWDERIAVNLRHAVLRHPGRRARHEEGRRRFDRQFQLGELPQDDGEALGLSGGQGGGDRHDARAGPRPRARQDPPELDHAGMDHDPAADRSLADAGGGGRI